MTKPIRPEDVLPDSQNIANLNGADIRKGSAGAFVQNVRALRVVEPGSADETALLDTSREIAKTLGATGFFEILAVRDERIAGLLGLAGA
jgi:hypothetical protein